jgi:hypothetical protein
MVGGIRKQNLSIAKSINLYPGADRLLPTLRRPRGSVLRGGYCHVPCHRPRCRTSGTYIRRSPGNIRITSVLPRPLPHSPPACFRTGTHYPKRLSFLSAVTCSEQRRYVFLVFRITFPFVSSQFRLRASAHHCVSLQSFRRYVSVAKFRTLTPRI